MAGGGVLGKRIVGKGIQGTWLSTDGPYRVRPTKRIATNSVVAHPDSNFRRTPVLFVSSLLFPRNRTPGHDKGDSQLPPPEPDHTGCTGSAETVPGTVPDDRNCSVSTPKKYETFCSPGWLQSWVSPPSKPSVTIES
jgi:hypothetical protein